MGDPRSFRRISHKLPAKLEMTRKSGEKKEYEAELKDLSVAALCLSVPGTADAVLRQGARTRISFTRLDHGSNLDVNGSILYTLMAEDGTRQCVILFDAIYEDVIATLQDQASVLVSV